MSATTRKIMQIATLPGYEATNVSDYNPPLVIALADDGTLWDLTYSSDVGGEWTTWRQLPPLPEKAAS